MATIKNFQSLASAKITTSGTSQGINFTNAANNITPTYKIANKTSIGCYYATGISSATAVASTASPAANCTYIAAFAEIIVNAPDRNYYIAFIQDGAPTTLEVSIGCGN